MNNKDRDIAINEIKQKIREHVWKEMEKRKIARFPKPIKGRIPNFLGSEKAGEKISKIPAFLNARTVFSNPDSPQRVIRYLTLTLNKTLIMATPKLKKGFLIIDGSRLTPSQKRRASTIRGAFEYGKKTDDLSSIEIDIKVTGSVATYYDGARLGKGGGFSDLEFAILREMGSITDETPIITSIHYIQLVEGIPMTRHDVPVDIILTPTDIIKTNRKYEKPRGIYWDELPEDKITSIPILLKLRRS